MISHESLSKVTIYFSGPKSVSRLKLNSNTSLVAKTVCKPANLITYVWVSGSEVS